MVVVIVNGVVFMRCRRQTIQYNERLLHATFSDDDSSVPIAPLTISLTAIVFVLV
jgi:hypothetical protein